MDVSFGKAFLLPVPEVAGYEFVSWLCDGEVISTDNFVISEERDFVLEASLKKTHAILFFDANCGNAIEKQIYLPGEVVELQVPSRRGYKFTGWFVNGQLLDGNVLTIESLEDINLVAHWELDKRFIVFISGAAGLVVVFTLTGTIIAIKRRKNHE